MSRISEERKAALLRRYGSNYANKAGMPGRGPGMRGPMMRGPGMRGPGIRRPGRGDHQKAGGPHDGDGKEKSKKWIEIIRRMFAYIGKDAVKIPVVFACVLCSTLASLGGSYVLRPVINNLVYADRSAEEKLKNLVLGIFIMAGIYSIGILCTYFQQKIMVGISQNALVKIRKDLFGKIQRLPVKYHDKHTHGEIMSRFTNDLDTVGMMLNNTLPQLFSGFVTLIGTVVLMFMTNWILALVTILTVPMIAYVGSAIGNRSRKYYMGQQQALGAVNGYIEEIISGQKVVKVFNHEETVMEEFEFLSDELRDKQMKAQFFGGIMGPVMGNLSQVSYSLSAVIGGILCITAGFDIGGLTIFTNYSRQFSRPVNELAMQINTVFAALAGAERVFEVMDEPSETEDAPDAIEVCSETQPKEGARPIKGEVVLKNVTFGYTPDKTVLKNINVTAKPGKKIAFVGSTGAGKTTIINLISRFYEIEEGQILLDGEDIRKIKRDSLRRNIAMVLQDTHLFSGTVMENIRYGRLDATDEEVITAARIANAHSFIERLPEGYNTVLEGDGVNLSQGQRQLLSIARAAVSKAPILILDEATSSVDTRTESLIQKGLDRLMRDRTTFIIAHRLSTVRNADLIVVLEHGEIVEQGTHEELLSIEGRYKQLYTGVIELD